MTELTTSKSKSFFNSISKLLGLYVAIACIIAIFTTKLNEFNVDAKVLQTGNLLLFVLSITNVKLHLSALENKNPNAAVQSVLLSTILKLFVLAGAVFAYLILAKQKSVYAIFGTMFFYILYTVVEKSVAMKLKK